jgi:hypothetical protein
MSRVTFAELAPKAQSIDRTQHIHMPCGDAGDFAPVAV